MMDTPQILAAVDIGSNAARLLVKSFSGEGDDVTISKLVFFRYPLRLGEEVFTSGRISEEKAKEMLRLMKIYRQIMKLYNVEKYRVCATSAMREAVNGQKVMSAIAKKTGLNMEIITGEEEASVVYGSHLEENGKDMAENLAYVDIGGGSTEIVIVKDGTMVSEHSYRIGTLRMLHSTMEANSSILSQIASDLKAIDKDIKGDIEIVGSGGNINKYFRLVSGKEKNSTSMTVHGMEKVYNRLKPLTLEERMESYDMKPDRADVIIPAGEILLTVAKTLDSKRIYVPQLGLVDGIIEQLRNNS